MSVKDKQKEELMKLTIKDLREILVKLGMSEEDAESFEKKKTLIATINTLRSQVKVETPGELKKEKKRYLSKKEIMRAKLMKEPRVRIKIPLQGKEKVGIVNWVYNKARKRKEQVYVSGAYTPFQINGFKWFVPHGVYNDVPETVAKMLDEVDKLTEKAGKPFLIDRLDPKTGKPVRDKLE